MKSPTSQMASYLGVSKSRPRIKWAAILLALITREEVAMNGIKKAGQELFSTLSWCRRTRGHKMKKAVN